MPENIGPAAELWNASQAYRRYLRTGQDWTDSESDCWFDGEEVDELRRLRKALLDTVDRLRKSCSNDTALMSAAVLVSAAARPSSTWEAGSQYISSIRPDDIYTRDKTTECVSGRSVTKLEMVEERLLVAYPALAYDDQSNSSDQQPEWKPCDAISKTAALARFTVSESTLKMMRLDGKISGYRSPKAAKNASYWYSESELRKHFSEKAAR